MRLEGDHYIHSTLDEGYDFRIKDRWKHEYLFRISTFPCPGGLLSEAIEVKNDESLSYRFTVLSDFDADTAKAEQFLKEKIKRGINRRHLEKSNGRWQINDNFLLRGRIDWSEKDSDTDFERAFFIDGKRITIEEFVMMLEVFEGWHFEMKILDSTDPEA
ncbi:MAG: hypothetical protein U5P10_04340 [Spirochaetia bacterium]|nr:hypothetical protein [Spirochaetia bacterium]